MRRAKLFLAVLLLAMAPVLGQVVIHKGAVVEAVPRQALRAKPIAQVQQTDFTLRVLFIVTVAQANSANTVLSNLATFPGEDTDVFSDANAVRLSPTGAEPPTHYAAWGFFQSSKETALRSAFNTPGRKSWYDADVDTLAKVLAIIDAEGLQRIVQPPF